MNLASLARLVLTPLSLVYGAIVRLRVWLYEKGVFHRKRLNAPVISVGNLTLGGTGKTPMVLWLAERFLAQGKRVAILTRGYKGAGGTSDEVALMKLRLNDRVHFGVGPNRYDQGRRLEQLGIDLFLLDDGFQHLQLVRDVNILLMDTTRPLSSERLLPAGRLREPISAMARADLLVLTRTETNSGTGAAIAGLGNHPVFAAQTRLLGFRKLGEGPRLIPADAIGQGPFFAFCGIGNPGAFLVDLESWGLFIADKKAFADHHRYSPTEAAELVQAARQAGATAFITTEKDVQNLQGAAFAELPVYFAVIDFVLPQEDAFLVAIQKQIASRQNIA